jgi:hypothetical protein
VHHFDAHPDEGETNFQPSRQLFPTPPIPAKSPLSSFATAASVVPSKPQQTSQPLRKLFTAKERKEYVQRTAQVLFTTEFIILIEFTEVIIPFIFSKWLFPSTGRFLVQMPS